MDFEIKSFVDVFADSVWSDVDITNRARAEVEGRVSAARQAELQVFALGALMGRYTPTPDQQAEISEVEALKHAAAVAATKSMEDMYFLQGALDCESASARLALPVVVAGQYQSIRDSAERTAALAVLSSAPPEVLALVSQRFARRNPTPEPILKEPEAFQPGVKS